MINKNGKGYLYLEVTRDKYEFPIHICDTLSELAEKAGVAKESISRQLARTDGNGTTSNKAPHWFRKVEYNECDNMEDLVEENVNEREKRTMRYINADYNEYLNSEHERIAKKRKYNSKRKAI